MFPKRPREAWIDLVTLWTPPLSKRRNLVKFLQEEGISVSCYSFLPRPHTRAALRELNLLEDLDDIIYSPEEFPEDVLVIFSPEVEWSTLPFFFGKPKSRLHFLTWSLV